MSYDDQDQRRRGGIETNYNGVRYKSKIESQIAMFLDRMEVQHQYEPENILFPKTGRHFMPDFFCPDINLWIEVKYKPNPYVLNDLKELSDLTKKESLLFTAEKQIIFTAPLTAPNFYSDDEEVLVFYCTKCDKISFVPSKGDWSCRACGGGFGDKGISGKLCLDKNELTILDYGSAAEIARNAKNIEQIRKKQKGDFSVDKNNDADF